MAVIVPQFTRASVAPERPRDLRWEQLTGWRLMDRYPNRETCYRWVLGKRHKLSGCDCLTDEPPRGKDCRPGWPIWDHVRRVVSPGGRRALLLEPFWFGRPESEALSAYCAKRGLDWLVNGCSPYAPSSTVAVVITSAGDVDSMPWLDGTEYSRVQVSEARG